MPSASLHESLDVIIFAAYEWPFQLIGDFYFHTSNRNKLLTDTAHQTQPIDELSQCRYYRWPILMTFGPRETLRRRHTATTAPAVRCRTSPNDRPSDRPSEQMSSRDVLFGSMAVAERRPQRRRRSTVTKWCSASEDRLLSIGTSAPSNSRKVPL